MKEQKPPPTSETQRDMLERAEKEASQEQPESFDEKAVEDKVVGIPPAGPGKKPIRGLDPK